jgi:hypothetical protein
MPSRSAIATHCGASSFQRWRASASGTGPFGIPELSCICWILGVRYASGTPSARRAVGPNAQ